MLLRSVRGGNPDALFTLHPARQRRWLSFIVDMATTMRIFVFLLSISFALSLGCAPRPNNSSLFSTQKIETEFMSLAHAFVSAPTDIVDEGFYSFYGIDSRGQAAREEWRRLKTAQIQSFLERAARDSSHTLDCTSLERSARRAGIDASRAAELSSPANVRALTYILAIHEIRHSMAQDTALMLAYREMRSK